MSKLHKSRGGKNPPYMHQQLKGPTILSQTNLLEKLNLINFQ